MQRSDLTSDGAAARKRKYGITEEQWLTILDACDWTCRACCKRFNAARRPAVDHDHVTGLVRGALCVPCNYAIGERHDQADWFARIAAYLHYPPALHEGIIVYVPGSPGAEEATS